MFQLILLLFGLSFMGDLYPTVYDNVPYTAPDQEHYVEVSVAQSANDSRWELTPRCRASRTRKVLH